MGEVVVGYDLMGYFAPAPHHHHATTSSFAFWATKGVNYYYLVKPSSITIPPPISPPFLSTGYNDDGTPTNTPPAGGRVSSSSRCAWGNT